MFLSISLPSLVGFDTCQAKPTRRRPCVLLGVRLRGIGSTSKGVTKNTFPGWTALLELCFLCDRWIVGLTEWEGHCRGHLDRPEMIPVQCDPLIYGGILGTVGYCPVCLGNTALSARERMRQFPRQVVTGPCGALPRHSCTPRSPTSVE
jgi:hypothetical protein